MRQRRVGLMVGALLAMAAPVLAQQQGGDSELQLQGSLQISTKSADQGGSNDTGAVAINAGRFFTDHQEVGVNGFGFFTAGDFVGLVGPFYRYNFGSGKTVPYIGGSINIAFGKFGGTSSGGGFAEAEAGVRWFLARNSAFSVAGSYNYDIKAHKFADQFQILFGFSHFWKK